MYRKNTAGQYVYFALVNATTGAALTGATVTGKRGIDGAAQASVTGTISEDAGGQYHLAMSQADVNGNNIGYLFTATNAIPVSISVVTTAADPTDAVHFGLSALPNAAAEAAGGLYTRGSGAGQINQSTNGQIDGNVARWLNTAVTAAQAGIPDVALKAILGTTLTETAGQIAAAFKKFFDKATPTGTINSLPDAAPGAAGGLLVDDVWTDARAAKLDNLDAAVTSRMASYTQPTGFLAASFPSAVGDATAANQVTINSNVLTRLATSGYTAPDNASIAIILGQTGTTGVILTSGERNATADALLARNVAGGSSAGRVVKEALYVLRNKTDISAGTLTVYGTDDTTPAFTAAVTTAAGNPISQIDPA